MYKERIKNICNLMKREDFNTILVTSPASVFYLTGKWIEPGERMLVLSIDIEGNTKLFVNELFPVECDLADEIVVFKDSDDDVEILKNSIDITGVVGIDKYWPAHFLIRLLKKCEGIEVDLCSTVIDEARAIKDKREIELMEEASNVNDSVIGDIISEIHSEMDELDVCDRLAQLYKKYGTEKFSFHPLIAYGGNAAEPHHDSDNTKLKEGDSVIIDIGGRTNNYCSDMTRTVFYKTVSEENKKVYNTVLEANRKAIDIIKPGVRFKDIDLAARNHIEECGYGKYFTHRTGHNIGIEVHEGPDVSSINEDVVREGMIFSVEPGIYIPNKVGVRIEDLVLVTKDGCKVLNSYNKELTII